MELIAAVPEIQLTLARLAIHIFDDEHRKWFEKLLTLYSQQGHIKYHTQEVIYSFVY